MKLAQLFSAYQSFRFGEDALREVTGITQDSRQCDPGQIFVALRGTRRDSHEFLPEVCAKDVAGVVVEEESRIPKNFRGGVLVVEDSHKALVRLASRFYGAPAEKLLCIGVTGTNGKTSTTYMIEAILNKFGLKTGVLGTINHHIGDKVWESELTTPDPVTLQKRLREFLALGAQAVAFEVSSHAVDQGRVLGIPFSCVVFTNLTRDHLDYHRSMENYFLAKEKLFRELPVHYKARNVTAVININDEWGRKIEVAPNVLRWSYGESQSDFQFQVLEANFSFTRFRLNCLHGEVDVRLPLLGRHNVYNAVAAIAASQSAGATLDVCKSALEEFKGVPGRLQSVPCDGEIKVFVDYAHTDDALRAVLTILGEIRERSHSKGRLITVFGCGGDRDKGKRPLMARVAIENSDIVMITSDNPRTEDPMAIIHDILVGVPKELMNERVFMEVDRREAIRKGIQMAGPRDVVLIAGKGHENYQIIGTHKHDFDDREVAKEVLNAR